jgi:hypothetical protein
MFRNLQSLATSSGPPSRPLRSPSRRPPIGLRRSLSLSLLHAWGFREPLCTHAWAGRSLQ